MSNKVFNAFKWAAAIGLPAIITFMGVCLITLQVPQTEAIMTIAVGFNTMVGALVGVSSYNYNKRPPSNP
jgi:hypothetical protein